MTYRDLKIYFILYAIHDLSRQELVAAIAVWQRNGAVL